MTDRLATLRPAFPSKPIDGRVRHAHHFYACDPDYIRALVDVAEASHEIVAENDAFPEDLMMFGDVPPR